jgi:hypothetical protein
LDYNFFGKTQQRLSICEEQISFMVVAYVQTTNVFVTPSVPERIDFWPKNLSPNNSISRIYGPHCSPRIHRGIKDAQRICCVSVASLAGYMVPTPFCGGQLAG